MQWPEPTSIHEYLQKQTACTTSNNKYHPTLPLSTPSRSSPSSRKDHSGRYRHESCVCDNKEGNFQNKTSLPLQYNLSRIYVKRLEETLGSKDWKKEKKKPQWQLDTKINILINRDYKIKKWGSLILKLISKSE